MRKYWILLCVAAGSLLLLGKIQSSQRHIISHAQPLVASVKHSSHLFDPNFFTQAYAKGEQYKTVENEQVVGGIMPHHLLAAPLIAGFFEGITNKKVTTIILLSPNHYGAGPYDITTSKGVWTTIFGDLATNIPKVEKLEHDNAAHVSEDLFDNEHGIYGITPFIKKSFPDATFVPIVIKGGIPKEECDSLVQSLKGLVDAHTLVLVSADFSHYLPSDQADIYDKESIADIESYNTDKVFALNHTKNIDSPESVYTLLKLMQLNKTTKQTLLEHTNSAKLTEQPDIQSTTSYLTMYFEKPKNDLSLNSIFQYIDPTVASVKDTAAGEYTIVATGDIIPARSVNAKLVQLNDFSYPFVKTVAVLKSADAVFINLESPLIPGCQSTLEGMVFCGDQRDIQGLVYAGVTVASIANNHAGNYGTTGIDSTVSLLKQHNIQVTGNGQPAIVTIKDKRFGFLGYNSIGSKESGIAWADIPQLEKDIQRLKRTVDFVIVTFHWGVEYTNTPTQTQISLAHAAIDAGADLIIGNHPHWVQGVEEYNGKFITYAHGNYVFDQMWSQETREGVLGKYTFNKNGLIRVSFIPVIIDDYSQPRFATQIEASRILTRLKDSSQQIKMNSQN